MNDDDKEGLGLCATLLPDERLHGVSTERRRVFEGRLFTDRMCDRLKRVREALFKAGFTEGLTALCELMVSYATPEEKIKLHNTNSYTHTDCFPLLGCLLNASKWHHAQCLLSLGNSMALWTGLNGCCLSISHKTSSLSDGASKIINMTIQDDTQFGLASIACVSPDTKHVFFAGHRVFFGMRFIETSRLLSLMWSRFRDTPTTTFASDRNVTLRLDATNSVAVLARQRSNYPNHDPTSVRDGLLSQATLFDPDCFCWLENFQTSDSTVQPFKWPMIIGDQNAIRLIHNGCLSTLVRFASGFVTNVLHDPMDNALYYMRGPGCSIYRLQLRQIESQIEAAHGPERLDDGNITPLHVGINSLTFNAVRRELYAFLPYTHDAIVIPID